ncbi:hypothetical protein HPP92_026831 [Vanilla planifolia]|uniref:Uncharacterized protein n=1 Tax=Vanilla planifolia TaxID=51239 RepID=A0A835PHY0_VANPL|nr:hypothetical protein HPP92_026831 [Vanilla planifolia]
MAIGISMIASVMGDIAVDIPIEEGEGNPKYEVFFLGVLNHLKCVWPRAGVGRRLRLQEKRKRTWEVESLWWRERTLWKENSLRLERKKTQEVAMEALCNLQVGIAKGVFDNSFE